MKCRKKVRRFPTLQLWQLVYEASRTHHVAHLHVRASRTHTRTRAHTHTHTHTQTQVVTKVIVKGELVIVPDLDGEFRSNLLLRLIHTPEVFLQTDRQTDGRTVRQMDRQSDGRTDGQNDPSMC